MPATLDGRRRVVAVHLLEHSRVCAVTVPGKRVAPCALHVPDHGECTASGTTEQRLRQRADEGRLCKLPALPTVLRNEVVPAWRASSEAGEQERDEPRRIALRQDIASPEGVVDGHGVVRPGPFLADQGALSQDLVLAAEWQPEAMGSEEQHVRCVGAAGESLKAVLGRGVADGAAELHRRVRAGQGGLDRLDESRGTELGRRVMSRPEEGSPTVVGPGTSLRGQHGPRVVGVGVDAREIEPADRVLHIKVVLEAERDLVGIAPTRM